MKKIVSAAILTLLFSIFLSSNSFAASEAECKIWVCLPGGFGVDCQDARVAMEKRIDQNKTPLPKFSSCEDEKEKDGSTMSYDYSYAAYIPEHQSCETHYGKSIYNCTTIDAHWIKDTRCIHYHSDNKGTVWQPKGCTMTKRYIDVLVDGIPVGETYYW